MVKILLADDMVNFLDLEISFLRRTDCEIITAENGIEALKKARDERPDLILLDVEMPQMTGIEACRHIKNDPVLKKIPVVMVTATDRHEECRKAGCDDFWKKPIKEETFLLGVKKHVDIAERETKRLSIGLEVSYEMEGRIVSAFTKDISTRGMFIITRETLPMGSDVNLTFTLPESQEELKVTGKVVRELKDQQDGHLVGGMGISFKDMDERSAEAIRDFVESNLSL